MTIKRNAATYQIRKLGTDVLRHIILLSDLCLFNTKTVSKFTAYSHLKYYFGKRVEKQYETRITRKYILCVLNLKCFKIFNMWKLSLLHSFLLSCVRIKKKGLVFEIHLINLSSSSASLSFYNAKITNR